MGAYYRKTLRESFQRRVVITVDLTENNIISKKKIYIRYFGRHYYIKPNGVRFNLINQNIICRLIVNNYATLITRTRPVNIISILLLYIKLYHTAICRQVCSSTTNVLNVLSVVQAYPKVISNDYYY